MDTQKIGGFISRCRREKGLTQVQLAQKLGVTNKSVSKWETGRCLPDASLYQELCGILDISLNELFAGERLQGKQREAYFDSTLKRMLQSAKRASKRSKIVISALAAALTALSCGFLLYAYGVSQATPQKLLNANWGIAVPGDLEQEFYRADAGFGDGTFYRVLEDKGYMEFYEGFSDRKNDALEQTVEELLTRLQVPPQNRPDFRHDYSWKSIQSTGSPADWLYCIYDRQERRLYFIEDIQ